MALLGEDLHKALGARMALTTEDLYRQLYRIRHVEERFAELYPTDAIQSPMHLSIGQEWISVGVCAALRPTDVVFGTYRSHALYLAKGGNLRTMIAELFGKATGCCKGKGGSMHVCDVQTGVQCTSAVVGTTIPEAVGYAYAEQLRGRDTVVGVFFGDGATEEGVFHESLNFAALHRLPVLFVCENNGYAIHTPIEARRGAYHHLDSHIEPYGMEARVIEGCDLDYLMEIATAFVGCARDGEGPAFIECQTGRWRQHVGPAEDYDVGYRERDELVRWREYDPLWRMEATLSDRLVREIQHRVQLEVQLAVELARQDPDPDPAEVVTDVLA